MNSDTISEIIKWCIYLEDITSFGMINKAAYSVYQSRQLSKHIFICKLNSVLRFDNNTLICHIIKVIETVLIENNIKHQININPHDQIISMGLQIYENDMEFKLLPELHNLKWSIFMHIVCNLSIKTQAEVGILDEAMIDLAKECYNKIEITPHSLRCIRQMYWRYINITYSNPIELLIERIIPISNELDLLSDDIKFDRICDVLEDYKTDDDESLINLRHKNAEFIVQRVKEIATIECLHNDDILNDHERIKALNEVKDNIYYHLSS